MICICGLETFYPVSVYHAAFSPARFRLKLDLALGARVSAWVRVRVRNRARVGVRFMVRS